MLRLILGAGLTLVVVAFVNPLAAFVMGIAGLVITGVAAVFSPDIRVKVRRSFGPTGLLILALLFLAGYLTARGII